MDSRVAQLRKRLTKKAKKGFAGYPVATVAFYGPDDKRASKLVVSILLREDADPEFMSKWFSDTADLRSDATVLGEAVAFIEEHAARSVSLPDRIIGCPHEEGVDYEGAVCPRCPFWAGRDRWAGVRQG